MTENRQPQNDSENGGAERPRYGQYDPTVGQGSTGGAPQYGASAEHQNGSTQGTSYPNTQQQGGGYQGNQYQGGAYSSGDYSGNQYQGGTYPPNSYQGGYSPYGQHGHGGRAPGWGLGLASLICGIVSIVFFWVYVPALAGLAAVIMGIISIRQLGRTPGASKAMPIIGLILGALGVILGVLMTILMIVGLAELQGQCGSMTDPGFQECVESYS